MIAKQTMGGRTDGLRLVRGGTRNPAAQLAREGVSATLQATTMARGAVVMGLLTIALFHLIDAPGTYDSTRYIFWMYLALIVGCVGGRPCCCAAPRAWDGWPPRP